jgi:hypothetical protein
MVADLLHFEDLRNDSSDNEPGTSDDNDSPQKERGDSVEDHGELDQQQME